MWTVDAGHDPFLPLGLAAAATSTIELATGIAVAFARSPMTVAETARDIQQLSEGRFHLGLGSQVRAHITRRYSMPWSDPTARMREFVLALRAIWHAWDTGEPLSFEGEYYQHNLMSPTFSGSTNPFGNPTVHLAGLGPAMTEVAGQVADGLILHRFVTREYLEAVTWPALERGAASAGGSLDRFEVSGSFLVVTGLDDDDFEVCRQSVRQQVAFYASTPAYRSVLMVHDRQDLHDVLRSMSREGRWEDMSELIDDDLLDKFAVVAEPEGVRSALEERFGKLAHRTVLTRPEHLAPERWDRIVERILG